LYQRQFEPTKEQEQKADELSCSAAFDRVKSSMQRFLKPPEPVYGAVFFLEQGVKSFIMSQLNGSWGIENVLVLSGVRRKANATNQFLDVVQIQIVLA
jgi:hypothetical protein